MKPIYFVTSNENKIREAEAILNKKLRKKELDIPEIQEIELDKIVKDKARKAYQILKKPVLVEDTGFYIKAWHGFPGVLMKWMLKTMGNKAICKAMREKNRNVTVKTYFCLYNGKKFHIFTGEVKGKIPKKPIGKTNFGWDPIFIPNGYKKTFAQMTMQEKNKISMRKIALMKLKEFLKH